MEKEELQKLAQKIQLEIKGKEITKYLKEFEEIEKLLTNFKKVKINPKIKPMVRIDVGYLTLSELKKLFDGEISSKLLQAALETLRSKWGDSGIELVHVASGWRFRSKPEMQVFLDRLNPQKPPRYSRAVLETLDADLVEMKRCKSNGLCCGAGGAQMFKEPEKGIKDINVERIDEALELNPNIIASGCPFCMTMLTDGVKVKDKEQEVRVLDIAEITARANGL